MTRRPFPRVWTATITVYVHPDGRQTLRDWLLANCEERPATFAAQLQWFIDCQLTGTADSENVALSFELAECRPVPEGEARP